MGKGEGWGEGQGQGHGHGAGGDDWQNDLCGCCSADCGNCKYMQFIFGFTRQKYGGETCSAPRPECFFIFTKITILLC